MKKVIAILTLSLILVSCGCGGESTTDLVAEVEAEEPDVVEMVEEEVDIAEIPESADIYRGHLPTASGEGMIVELALFGDKFVRSMTYVTENDTFIEEGMFILNEDGNIMTLKGVEPETQYLFVEDAIYTLDADGKKVEGPLAEHYRLDKVEPNGEDDVVPLSE